MRILLLGEFSGLYKNLKHGLIELGHEVTLLADGDGWKQIPGADGPLKVGDRSRLIDKVGRNLSLLKDERLIGYDAVFLVAYRIFNPFVAEHMVRFLRKNNGSVLLSAAGGGLAYDQAYLSGRFDYSPYDGNPCDCSYVACGSSLRSKLIERERRVVEKYFCEVIPVMWEYQIGFDDWAVPHDSCIPLPVDVSECDYVPNIPQDKIVIFHGINREEEKGTPIIREALARIERDYSNDVEVIIDGRMPYEKYLSVIQRANVVIDQCRAYGYGLNACVSMAQGKAVLSGARDETLEAFGIKRKDCPILPIEPDSDQICRQLKWVIEHRNQIPGIGIRSRAYIEKYHDSIKIAGQYVDVIKKHTKG
ncbi:glycosyltransferase family 4 protein [Adlercreutzia sp. ZJ141]|uniref:glycosyltransferase family 4 protein n=1 Tax=Adlercreutzia sp. ZJ141 TaxID=2709406 RepID=UPI0013EDC06A|nr:glycosyltransferase family 4 protein [Adlercreutzia sp. ZJ141]